jgi:hypothetical protein
MAPVSGLVGRPGCQRRGAAAAPRDELVAAQEEATALVHDMGLFPGRRAPPWCSGL